MIPITTNDIPDLVRVAAGDFSFVTINSGSYKPEKKGRHITWTYSFPLRDYSWSQAYPF